MYGTHADAMPIETRAADDADLSWIRSLLADRWGGTYVVSRGIIHHPDQLPGFVALESDQPVGLATYDLRDGDCEIVTLDSLESGMGVGTALVKAVARVASTRGCKRIWLITTNDNTRAIRFYQKTGFGLVTIHRNAIDESRKLKPSIPETGNDGIPIRDEIELEMLRP